MEKSSEQFLPENLHYTPKEAENEAQLIQAKIDSGEAKDISEAEGLAALETLDTATQKLDRVEKNNEGLYYADDLFLIIHPDAHPGTGFGLANRVIGALRSLPNEVAFEKSVGFLEAVEKISDNSEKESKNNEGGGTRLYIENEEMVHFLADTIVDSHVTPDTIDKFLSSPLERLADPTNVLEKMAKLGASNELIEKLTVHYGKRIDLEHANFFGNDGILKNLEVSKKTKMLTDIVERLQAITNQDLEEVARDKKGEKAETYSYPGQKIYRVGLRNFGPIVGSLKQLREAAEQGIVAESQVLETLDNHISQLSTDFSRSFWTSLVHQLEEIRVIYKKLSPEK